jgi:hypothetical protein
LFGIFIFMQSCWVYFDYLQSRRFTALFFSRLLLFAVLLLLTWLASKSTDRQFRFKPWMFTLLLTCDLFILSMIAMPRTGKDLFFNIDQCEGRCAHLSALRSHRVSPIPWDLELWPVGLEGGDGVIFACIRNGIDQHQQVLNKITNNQFNPTALNSVRPETMPVMNFLAVRRLTVNTNGLGPAERKTLNLPPSFHIFGSGAGMEYYENNASLDFFGLYYSAVVVPDDNVLDVMFSPSKFDPASMLLISPKEIDPAIVSLPGRSRKPGEVKIISDTDQNIELETMTDAPAYLSVAQSYYPGWRAWVDGGEEKIIRADYAYQAVAIKKPGAHRIILKFMPAEFRIGLWTSLASIFIFALLTLAAACKPGRDPGATGVPRSA